MSEAKHCGHCGAEPNILTCADGNEIVWFVSHTCADGTLVETDTFASKEEAERAWDKWASARVEVDE